MIIKKKELAAKALNVGKARVKFVKIRIDEIKDAITKQDIRDLVASGAIVVKPIKGRKSNVKRRNRRGQGKVKIKVKTRKQDYVKITRKLRKHVKTLKTQGQITHEEGKQLRKEIRNKAFKSKASLNAHIGENKK